MSILAVTCENPADLKIYRENGADEVIFALKDSCFSPLCSFETEEILNLIRRAHKENLRLCVLMNRLFHENEMEEAARQMERLIRGGADGIIFADAGLMDAALRNGSEDRMIYQPETMMTSLPDVSMWCQTGVQAVMISTLLTGSEILEIVSNTERTGMNIHGFQLMSVSARPLLSAWAETAGKQALRFQKDLSLVEAKRQEHMPVYENEYATMIFTDYVLESFGQIRELQAAGMERFVIDSWHLDRQSVIEAAALYRSLLAGTADESAVETYRSRYADIPFSKGYYDQKTVR